MTLAMAVGTIAVERSAETMIAKNRMAMDGRVKVCGSLTSKLRESCNWQLLYVCWSFIRFIINRRSRGDHMHMREMFTI